MARLDGSDVLRALAALAVLVGFFMFLFGTPILFSPHEVDCDGHAMQPGDLCGPYPLSGQGSTYPEVAQENAVRRWIGYSGIVLFGWGALTLIAAAIRDRWC